MLFFSFIKRWNNKIILNEKKQMNVNIDLEEIDFWIKAGFLSIKKIKPLKTCYFIGNKKLN
jgi:hypothetical protein